MPTADSAVAMAFIDLVDSKDRIATIEFKINFFASVDNGELDVRAEINHKGSKTAVGDVEVVNAKGKSVAKIVATYTALEKMINVTDFQPGENRSSPHGQRRIMGERDEICSFSSEARCTGAITRGSVI